MLQNEETIELIKLAQKGDEPSKAKLVEHNIPLIKSIVRRYRNKQIEYDDLIQLGTLGLIKAVNNFNLDFGVRFSTYAVPMIAGEIKRFIRDDGAIKVSRSTKSLAQKINQFIEEYRHNNNAEPNVQTIADQFDIDAQEVVFAMESSRYPISISAETDDDGISVGDKIAAKGTIDDTINIMVLRDMISLLDAREKRIIVLRYYKDKTQSEIAAELGVSQVQVSRLEAKILEKIKKELA